MVLFYVIKVEMDPMGNHNVIVMTSLLTLNYSVIKINVADSIKRR